MQCTWGQQISAFYKINPWYILTHIPKECCLEFMVPESEEKKLLLHTVLANPVVHIPP
jgi:hypothetical protein